MNITKGKISKAQKVVIYGPEGIGKSTLSSKFPDPIFIDIEGSTGNMDVARMDRPTSWTMLLQQCEWVKQTRPCKSLVLDTVDWAERMAIEHICSINSKKSIEDFGYGAGYIKLEEELGRFLNLLQDLVDIGINVIQTAHAQVRKFEQPDEMGAYDRYELKLGKKTSSRTSALVKEWADIVLFCNYKIMSVATDDKGKKFKGQGGQRVMYTTHHPAWDAKNRFDLPEELPLDYTHIAHIFNVPPTLAAPVQPPYQTITTNDIEEKLTPKTSLPVEEPKPDFETNIKITDQYHGIPAALADLMRPENVTPEEIQNVVGAKGYYPVDTPVQNYDQNFVSAVLIGAWQQVLAKIKEDRELPF